MRDPDASLPIDDKVVLPPSVQRSIDAVAAIHAAAYPSTPDPAAAAAAAEAAAATAAAAEAAAATAAAAAAGASTDTPAQPQAPQRAQVPETGEPGSWEHRFHAMKGRYDQAQQTIGGMQEQMQELGNELVQTQQMLRRPAAQEPGTLPQDTPRAPRRAITEADLQTYGPELVDFVQRAAVDAAQPLVEQVSRQTRQVTQQVRQTAAQAMYADLARAVPNWEEINVDPKFKAWCRSVDVYSGVLRSRLLNAAVQAANAPRVIAFFQGFLNEERATGQLTDPQPQAASQEAPRQAAVPLESLTAPGRAKPASGPVPGSAADKPVITRAQIAAFYASVRRGDYAGREADKAKDEAIIFSAQAEGRVR